MFRGFTYRLGSQRQRLFWQSEWLDLYCVLHGYFSRWGFCEQSGVGCGCCSFSQRKVVLGILSSLQSSGVVHTYTHIQYLSIYLSVCLSINLSVCLSVYLTIYIYISKQIHMCMCMTWHQNDHSSGWHLARLRYQTSHPWLNHLENNPL
jgi:hypothetical protein